MSEDIRTQIELATELNEALIESKSHMKAFAEATRNQTQFAMQISQAFANTTNHLNRLSSYSSNIVDSMNQFANNVNDLSSNKAPAMFRDLAKNAENVADKYEDAARQSDELAKSAEKTQESVNAAQKAIGKNANQHARSLKNVANVSNKSATDILKLQKIMGTFSSKEEELVDAIGDAAGGMLKFAKGVGGLLSSAKSLLSVLGSIIGTATNLAKTFMSLPFMVLKEVVVVGNAFRQDIQVTIEQAAQDTKDFFDAQSNIGQSIRRITNESKGMLKTFASVNSEAVKLFGAGAAGAAQRIKELNEGLKAMGTYSELFAGEIGNNRNFMQFTRLRRILGLESQDIAYFSQDAAVNLTSINDRLTTLVYKSENISKEYSIDAKRLRLNFNKLRKEIALFDHLTDDELYGTAAKMTQMKMSVEDAVSIFKKFNTFEDAANSVAMLSQTFGMNLDAMQIIKAENPIEIFEMFRDSMEMTGRSFADLNRFEKEILADQTGMSQENLKAMMTFRDQGLTFEEAQAKMESQKPEQRQIKAMKEMSSAMKQLQKILTFNSPFQAFFDGLMKNIKVTGEARKAAMALSNTYQMIHDFALDLDPKIVEALAEPIVLIVRSMSQILNSPAFKGGLKTVIGAFGDLAMNAFGISDVEKIHHKVIATLNKVNKRDYADFKKDIRFIDELNKPGPLQTLYNKFKTDKKYAQNPVLMFKNFIEEAKRTPAVKKEYESMMKGFEKRYGNFRSLPTRIRKDGTAAGVTKFTKAMNKTLSNNKQNFKKFFDLSGHIAGAIIKGASVLLVSGINLLNHAIDDAYNATKGPNKGKSLIETFFNWEPGELQEMLNAIVNGFSQLFQRTGKLAFFGAWLTGQFFELASEIGGFFLLALKKQGQKMFPSIFGTSVTQAEALSSARIGQKGYTMKDLKTRGGKSGPVASKDFDTSDLDSLKSVSAILESGQQNNQNKEVFESIRTKMSNNVEVTKEDYKKLLQVSGAGNYNVDKKDIIDFDKNKDYKKLTQFNKTRDTKKLTDAEMSKGLKTTLLENIQSLYLQADKVLGFTNDQMIPKYLLDPRQTNAILGDSLILPLVGKYLRLIEYDNNTPNKEAWKSFNKSDFDLNSSIYKALYNYEKNKKERERKNKYKNVTVVPGTNTVIPTDDGFFTDLFAMKSGGAIDLMVKNIKSMVTGTFNTASLMSGMFYETGFTSPQQDDFTNEVNSLMSAVDDVKNVSDTEVIENKLTLTSSEATEFAKQLVQQVGLIDLLGKHSLAPTSGNVLIGDAVTNRAFGDTHPSNTGQGQLEQK